MTRYRLNDGRGYHTYRDALAEAQAGQTARPDRVITVYEYDAAPRARRYFRREVWPAFGEWKATRDTVDVSA